MSNELPVLSKDFLILEVGGTQNLNDLSVNDRHI
jgi:hypothetical protein